MNKQPSRRPDDVTLLQRHEVEMIGTMAVWAEERLKKQVRIREVYQKDERPKAECQVLIDLIKSLKNVKDFYTVSQ
jgi:hypothetical protein